MAHEMADILITNQQSLYCCSLMQTNGSVNYAILFMSKLTALTTFYVHLVRGKRCHFIFCL